MVIKHNKNSLNAFNHLGIVTADLADSTEKLSSGYRINRSADDAAGLTISEKMRCQIRGLNRASSNAQDGISFIQTAEGALNEVHSLLQRGRELSTQAANDTNTKADRDAIQEEIDALKKEIDRIAKDTEFNTMKVFDSDNAPVSQVPYRSANQSGPNLVNDLRTNFQGLLDTYFVDFAGAAAQATGKGFTATDMENFANSLKNNYLPTLLNKITTAMPGVRPDMAGLQIGLKYYHTNDRSLAYVASNGIGYELGINTYYLSKGASGINMEDDLATTIAHEMTHAIMFDMTTNGMLGSAGGDSFPSWFVEGTAQAVGGAINYCQELTVNRIGNDAAIRQWLSHLTDTSNSYNAYAQGYIGAMYLGYVTGDSNAVTSQNIASGINKLLSDVADGYSLSEAIYRRSNGRYQDLADFERNFANDAVTFTKELVNQIGSGTGSIVMQNLSDTKSQMLSNPQAASANDYFSLDINGANSFVNNNYYGNGVNPYTGGGATTTNRTDRGGNINPNAAGT